MDKARKYFDEFLETDSPVEERHSACMYLANINAKDYSKVIEYSKKAIELMPDYAEPFFKMAWAYFQRGNYRKCIEISEFAFNEKILRAPFGTPSNVLEFSLYPSRILEEAKAKEVANMDISKLSVSELKALAYDQISLMEQSQMNLKLINEEINKKRQANLFEKPVKIKNTKK